MRRHDVIVVGGGPVGLLSALGLARRGLDVLVLEAEDRIVDSPRAMVYLWATLAGLDGLGVLDDMLDTGFTKTDFMFHFPGIGEEIRWDMSSLEGHAAFPYNVHLGQNRLAEIAARHLQRLGVEVRWGHRFSSLKQDDAGVAVVADTAAGPQEFAAAWVVAADGARSAVRSSLGIDFPGMTWDKRFVATNIRADLLPAGFERSNVVADAVYGAVVVKIDKEDLWRCTYCEPESLPADGVLQRLPGMLDRILKKAPFELVQHSPYRMHQRSAEHYRIGRVVLAGDAAHTTNPTGGLGLTSGLFDVFVLEEALAAVVEGSVGEDVLDRYASDRAKAFLEVASPQASENNRLTYNTSDPQQLRVIAGRIRETFDDPAKARARLMGALAMETPSLVTGRVLNAQASR